MTTFQAAEPNFKEIQEAIRTLRNNKYEASTVAAVILETLSIFLYFFIWRSVKKIRELKKAGIFLISKGRQNVKRQSAFSIY